MTQQQSDPQDQEAVARMAKTFPELRKWVHEVGPGCMAGCVGHAPTSVPEALAYLVAHRDFKGLLRDLDHYDATWGYSLLHTREGPSAIQALDAAIVAAEETQNG